MYATRASSNKTGEYNLTDKNHITSNPVPVAKLYKALGLWSEEDVVPQGLVARDESYTVSINSWTYPGINEDWEGNPLDLHIYHLDGGSVAEGPRILWEPYIEYLYRRNFLTNYYKPNVLHRVAYVDGMVSHLGPAQTQGYMAANCYDGYMLYQSMKSK